MQARKLLAAAFLVLGLCLAANPGAAVLVTALPDGTIDPMPAANYSGPGPETFGPGITWSSTNTSLTSPSLFGWAGFLSFGANLGNGTWNPGIGSKAGLDAATGAMTFAFSTPVGAVGGFLNYKPITGSNPTIAVYDAANHLLESYTLNFTLGPAANKGYFFGFQEATNDISYFTLSNSYIGITNLTTAYNATPIISGNPAPLPATILLLGTGLLGLVGLRRVRKS